MWIAGICIMDMEEKGIIMKKQILIIAFLALVFMLAIPASAYNLEWAGTISNKWKNDYVSTIQGWNSSKLGSDVTLIRFTGIVYAPYISGSYSDNITSTNMVTVYGTYTMMYQTQSANNWSSQGTIDVFITSFGGLSYSPQYQVALFNMSGTGVQSEISYYGIGDISTNEFTTALGSPTPSSGLLFGNQASYSGTGSIPTPTSIPTPIPTVAPGYVRNTYLTADAQSLATIHGTNIMLYDTYANIWKNTTNCLDGTSYIDTLPYTTIDAYSSYTAFPGVYADGELLGGNAGSAGTDREILMTPIGSPPPAGYVNLFLTTESNIGNHLSGVSVVATWNGIQHAGTSSLLGSLTFVVPNNTQINLKASLMGFHDAIEIINSGPGTYYTHTILLYPQYITATQTPAPGVTTGTTIGPYGTPGPGGTYAPGYTNNQGQMMMDLLAQNGLSIVMLCILVTIISLIKMIAK
jgi:hypothetical protein